MSAIWTVVIVFAAAFLSAVVLILAALFTPVVLVIDSGRGQARLRWLAVLEYRRPLPWTEGESRLSFAGRPVRVAERQRRKKRKPGGEAAAGKPPKDRARFVRFLRRCLRTPTVRRVLTRRLVGLGKRILHSAALKDRQIRISLPDPAWNGMLAGWLACHRGNRPAVQVDFSGQNALFLEIHLYPFRVAKALFLFSVGLPYRSLWREWRAASAMPSG